MKALYFQDVEKLEYGTIEDPKIVNPHDAIVKATYCGVCGSDLHVLHGLERGIEPGTVFGHEFVGEVVEKGSEVKHLKLGDIVSTPFSTSCGNCYQCESALPSRCVNGDLYGWLEGGSGLHGSHSEYIRVPWADATLVPLPESVPQEEGILLGDNLSTGFYCAEMANCAPGKIVVVLGCGTVGVCSVVAAKYMGVERVFAVDGVEWRRGVAKRMGAEDTFSPDKASDQIMQLTDGRGADCVCEVVGNSSAQRLAYEILRPGGVISTVGVHTAENFAFSPANAYDKNVTYRVGRCPARHYMNKILPLLAERQLNLTDLITHKMPLSEGAEAYKIFSERRAGYGKILLQP